MRYKYTVNKVKAKKNLKLRVDHAAAFHAQNNKLYFCFIDVYIREESVLMLGSIQYIFQHVYVYSMFDK